ncbi:MAG: hypothetical protein OHK0046_48010 [Anaerolineae bacterium]
MKQTAEEAVEQTKPVAIVFDISRWTMRDYEPWAAAANGRRIGELRKIVAANIVSTPYLGAEKMRDPDAYSRIRPAEWQRMSDALTDHIASVFKSIEEPGKSGWSVDFSAWYVEDVERWYDANNANNFVAIRKLLSTFLTSTPYGINTGDPEAYLDLDLYQWGTLMKFAVESFRKLLQA